jgi:hypothetical protein
LLKSDVLHIDCFALDISIRGNNLSYEAFNSFIITIESELNKPINRILMEVYTHNIDAWNKIMNLEVLKIDHVVKQKVKSDVIIMGKGFESNTDALNAYLEWSEFELNW